ncbi:MAG: EAL domain-containing protein [Deltaproteobacteria bacterium]|nr:EAL domain-containing protein [Deltaproteobacteria bacterium]
MRRSIRTTMLAIVLPLAVVTLSVSAARVADLLAIRQDVAGFRDSAFRSIYAERYVRNLHVLVRASFDHLVGEGEGFEAVASAHANMADTLGRLRLFVHEAPSDDATVSELTLSTLTEWQKTQEQVDLYLQRAVAFAEDGDPGRARRLVTDELEVLLRSRIFSSIDLIAQREQELLEEHRVRVTRATGHWLARAVGVIDLREQLLPDVYEAILTERFARTATAEFKSFTYTVLEGRPLDASHGVAELAATYALVGDAYARTLALPAASLRDGGRSVVRRLGDVFERSLLPRSNAIVRAHEQSIERQMARLDHFVHGILLLSIALAVIALLLGLGSPYLVSRLMVGPVVDLVETVSRFRAGNKDARPRVRANNELGLLAFSLKGLLDELQESNQKVHSLAFYDSRTGLPNRQFFQERLAGALVSAQLQGRTMALLTVSPDGLEQVKETLGPRAGDDLVFQVATRLHEMFRLTDIVSHPDLKEWDTHVSHLGGDEFTILLTKIREPADAAIAAQRILGKIGAPFDVEGQDIVVRPSVGIGVYPQNGGDADTLLRNSSAAMNEARKQGGSLYQFHSETMNIANSRRLQIQSRLSGAIERGDLALHYQPIHDAKQGHLTGAEQLLRWVDSELGPIGPDEFIPIAEQAGLISSIGRWVLSGACDQIRAWRDAGYAEIRMSVNVSASQLRDEDWVDSVATTLREKGVSSGCLELEITETTVIQDPAKTGVALTKLSDMGVGIALDDFGTGYSSLAHLRRLPICRVKIDRSFVSEISESEEGAALTGAIVGLAHNLQLGVVAEGVETHEQVNFLRSSGCDEIQGYLISRAVPAEEFERFLTREKPESPGGSS